MLEEVKEEIVSRPIITAFFKRMKMRETEQVTVEELPESEELDYEEEEFVAEEINVLSAENTRVEREAPEQYSPEVVDVVIVVPKITGVKRQIEMQGKSEQFFKTPRSPKHIKIQRVNAVTLRYINKEIISGTTEFEIPEVKLPKATTITTSEAYTQQFHTKRSENPLSSLQETSEYT